MKANEVRTMELDNKKMWESLIRECDKSHDQSISNWIFNVRIALADQGLQYNSGTKKIESIEPESKQDSDVKWYVATEDVGTYHNVLYGNLPLFLEGERTTKEKAFAYLPNMTEEEFKKFFRLATPEEIPYEPKQENTLKDVVEASKEIITCAEDFQKQKTSDGELTEFEKEIAHVLVYKCYDGSLETEEEIHNAYRQYYDDAKFFAPMLLAKARKQIASEINIDERVQKFKDVVKEKPYGILACLTLHGAYKLGMDDTLKAIKEG